jgi:rod shape determining protein RodA
MFVSVGMTVGLVPVIGLPLPLVSYGGTSVVASLAMIGLLHSVDRSAR